MEKHSGATRGLVHGATLISLVSLFALIFAFVSPMWFVYRTEEGTEQCWHGEGIFFSRYWWGSSLWGAPCEDPLRIGPLSTTEAYCSEHPVKPLPGDPEDYNARMCTATTNAKVLAIVSILLAAASSATGMAMGLASTQRQKHEMRMAVSGFVTGGLSTVFAAVASMVMFYSPLFSRQHNDALSKQQRGQDFNGYTCMFQTPLHDVFSLLSSAAEHCVLLGPSVLVLFCVLITSGMSVGLFGIMIKNQAFPGFSITRDDQLHMGNSHVYSMYGAAARRFAHVRWWQRFFLITVVPVIFILSTALCWAVFLLLGLQVIVYIRIGVVPVGQVPATTTATTTTAAALATSAALDWVVKQAGLLKPGTYFSDTLNVFNFSPMTSIVFFWDAGARFIALGTFVAVLIVPISRVVLWVWFFYAPGTEMRRGRILSWVDFTGKYILAFLFIIQVIGVALTFERNLTFPFWMFAPGLIPHGDAVVVDIRVGLGSGLGTTAYICTALLSLVIGQAMVAGHHMCTTWETERRTRRLLGGGGSGGTPGTTSSTLTSSSSPLLSEFNSPTGLTPSSFTLTSARPQPLLRANRRSVLDVLASFGSTVDLSQHDRAPSLPSNVAEHLPLLRSLGSNVDVPTADVHGLAPALHPPVEALCDRVHSPLQGVRLRWTPGGKILVWLFLFLYVGNVLILQSLPIVKISKLGVAGKLIVEPKSQVASYSLLSFFEASAGISIDHSPAYGALFFVFTALFPVVNTFFMLILWTIEMTIAQQKRVFYALEIFTAWSCLDVFLITIIIMRVELEIVTKQIIDYTIPGLAELIEFFLPFKSIMSANMSLLPGFALFIITCIMEKLLLFGLMEQTIVAISEREAESVLRSFAQDIDSPSGALSAGSHIVEDAAEGLLEHDAGAMFSPAARYFSSYFPHAIYSGLPRTWWSRYFVWSGLMSDAARVQAFYATGAWPEPASGHGGPRMPEDAEAPPRDVQRVQAELQASWGALHEVSPARVRIAGLDGGDDATLDSVVEGDESAEKATMRRAAETKGGRSVTFDTAVVQAMVMEDAGEEDEEGPMEF